MRKLIYVMLAMVIIMSVSSLVARGGDDNTDTSPGPQFTQDDKPTATATAAEPNTPTAKPIAATAGPNSTTAKPITGGSGELSDMVSANDLKSYKQHMVLDNMTVDMEVVNVPPPRATHSITSGLGNSEVITIGDTTWTNMAGGAG